MQNSGSLKAVCVIFVICIATLVAAPAQDFTTLHSFNVTDGVNPGALVQGSDGNFYGITGYGGAHGLGTFFKITAAGTLTTLHSFDSTEGSLVAGLVQGTDGNFYG